MDTFDFGSKTIAAAATIDGRRLAITTYDAFELKKGKSGSKTLSDLSGKLGDERLLKNTLSYEREGL